VCVDPHVDGFSRRWAAKIVGWCDLAIELFLLANIRRVPQKESPIRQCQSEATNGDMHACRTCAADARALPPFGRCGARPVDAYRIGGVRIVVCFDIYPSRSKKTVYSIIVHLRHLRHSLPRRGTAPSSC
jgi:hypothetical protein